MKQINYLKEMNARNLWHPMAHPADSLANPPDIMIAGDGVELTDVDGHRMIDAVGGLWNVNLGFSCEPIKEAMIAQIGILPYSSTFRGLSNDAVIELSQILKDFFEPDGLSRAFFTSGGSDSVEVSLRLARQYHKIRGDSGRVKFLSLKKGYHGTHMLGASVNGNSNFRTQYEPLMPGCYHIPAPYTYRNPFNETDPKKLSQLCLAAMEDEIKFQSAYTIAAMIMEPILGAGGVIVPHESFMPGVRELCDRYGILLIADEVITAFGRTGSWTGSRLWGVKPDMACTAKAITNGYFPFGAVMICDGIAEVFESDRSGKGSIGSGYTYSGHPIGAATAIACLKETMRLKVNENAAARGAELFDGLNKLKEKYNVIGDVRGGRGLMCALELVSDNQGKVSADKAVIKQVHRTAYEEGVMIRASGSNIILSPPLIVTSQHVQKIHNALDKSFAEISV